MAEVLLEFENAVRDGSGRTWAGRVCGRQADDGLWEGWLEFTPHGGGAPVRTPRETKQPKHSDLAYWATGLTAAYLEGALERALHPAPAALRSQVAALPAFDGPAPPIRNDFVSAAAAGPGVARRAGAVLDPFEVYAQGEDVLRRQLAALDELHLRNLVRAYGLVDPAAVELQALSQPALIELVTAAVQARVR